MPKRLLDTVVSALALACLLPLLILVGVAVRIDSSGPALFRQRRVGRYGNEFTLWKFRSMRVARPTDEGSKITAAGDARITRLGRFLRRTKIDELPQLWNVLRGDMSLVGPRPEVPEYVALYTPEQSKVLSYRPGITCVSSLEMYDEESLLADSEDPERAYSETILPHKVRLAIDYARDASVFSDLKVIARTAIRVLALGGNRPGCTTSMG